MASRENTRHAHSVLLVEGDRPVRNILDQWLHAVEKDIKVDQVETVEEAKEMLRHQGGKEYDLVIADEYLPGLGTGLDLYRHCTDEYPTVPFLVTSRVDLNKYLDLEFPPEESPPILDPGRPRMGRFLIARMLNRRSTIEKDDRSLDRVNLGVFVLTVASLMIAAGPSIAITAKTILQNPPFTQRFVVPKTQPLPLDYDKPILQPAPYQEILPPPPAVEVMDFEVASVFTPELKGRMEQILRTADEILAANDVVE